MNLISYITGIIIIIWLYLGGIVVFCLIFVNVYSNLKEIKDKVKRSAIEKKESSFK